MEKYLNPACSPEERAEDLLAKMSLKEKMGQVVGFWPKGLGETDELRAAYLDGVGNISCVEMRSLTSFEEVVRFQREIQETVMELSEHHIPAMFHKIGRAHV